jgi:type II secretory pathway pseudopilin PulG
LRIYVVVCDGVTTTLVQRMAPTGARRKLAVNVTSLRRIIEISATLIALLLAAMAMHAWLAEHDDQLRLQATIAAQKQLLEAADTRERDRTAALKDTLAQIESLKRSVQTPAEILRDLPKYLPLPQPISMAPAAGTSASQQGTAISNDQACRSGDACASRGTMARTPASRDTLPAAESSQADSLPSHREPLPDSPVPAAQIPTADLKPLYDYVQDCRSCQAQLAAAKLNAADNAAKLTAISRERDAALTAAKGGTFWRRLRRNALWFAVGVGAGTVAACANGHCR